MTGSALGAWCMRLNSEAESKAVPLTLLLYEGRLLLGSFVGRRLGLLLLWV